MKLYFVACTCIALFLASCASPNRDPAARGAPHEHEPTSLKVRTLRHRADLGSGQVASPVFIATELSGAGVISSVVANSKKRGGPRDMTHYNPSVPEIVLIRGQETRVLAVRAEERGSEHSHIRFFEVTENGEKLRRIVDESIPALSAEHPALKLQDPSLVVMDGDLYIGGVEVTKIKPSDRGLSYRHVIYKARGRELSELSDTPVFVGVWGKKGTRFEKLKDGRLLVVSRPQGEKGGRGKIAWAIVSPGPGESFQDTMDRGIAGSRLFEGHVNALEWEGPNKLYVLPDGNVLFMSHQAAYSGGARRKGGENARKRAYVCTFFLFNPSNGEHTQPQVVLERKDLPGGVARGAKRVDLSNVIYTSGIETNADGSIKVGADGTLTLWFGEGDLLVGHAKIANFLLANGVGL